MTDIPDIGAMDTCPGMVEREEFEANLAFENGSAAFSIDPHRIMTSRIHDI
jgi:hypothetical protein